MNSISKPILRRTNHTKKMRAVRCIDTGVVYASGRDAAEILIEEEIVVNPEDIRKVCKGIRKSAGGYRWEYIECLSS